MSIHGGRFVEWPAILNEQNKQKHRNDRNISGDGTEFEMNSKL
jgi:hypothetical protein